MGASQSPAMVREQRFTDGTPTENLVQRIQGISFSIEEEDELGELDVFGRVQASFDVEKVTKKFYESFKEKHDAFLTFIQGLDDMEEKQWYASIMLNRLMFVYFVQRKGFLDGNQNYLRDKLAQMKAEGMEGNFLTFYRRFLLKLFHQGLGQNKSSREPEVDRLIGDIPYLNGGLFDIHSIEESNPDLDIPDEAFERVFDFFDKYDWHLDERPLKNTNEINPDVLGYIFEKYINQKQMGAYYTQEDVTGYITQNTVIPYLFDATEKECHIAFRPDSAMWELLADNPDSYIYDAVLTGVDEPLPEEIAAGIDEVSKRRQWNRAADTEYALPTETWREYVARRQRCEELRSKMANGEISSIDELITLNLNIRQFAEDAVINCEGADFLRAFYKAVREVSVLDPTCGSGAFLFAALNVLEPLYDACLERMQQFVEEDSTGERYQDFRENLAEVDDHTSRRYFILKSIMVNNLYGVDIMEEAVEIARLRLFLKLMAQIERREAIEPLPDLDFNLRAGNTLVGFASMDALRNAPVKKLDFGGFAAKIDEEAAAADVAFKRFRSMQTEDSATAISEILAEAKTELRKRLRDLNNKLDQYLAAEYGVESDDEDAFAAWRESHQPFHWLVEFYGIMQSGGFDVIVGNPPYVVYSKAKVPYRLEPCGYETLLTKNLYAIVFERSISLTKADSPVGLIVQLTSLSAEKLPSLQNLLRSRTGLRAIPFPRRPESIFDGVEMPVSILLSTPNASEEVQTSRVQRFYTEERPYALPTIRLIPHAFRRDGHRIAKLGSDCEKSVYEKLSSHSTPLDFLVDKTSSHLLYYQEACRYWVKSQSGLPYFKRNGVAMEPPHGRVLRFKSEAACSFAVSLTNSSLFYWFYGLFSDCEHINDKLLRSFNIPSNWQQTDWKDVSKKLSESLRKGSDRKIITTNQGHTIEYDEMKAARSKEIIDEIDQVLAEHYGFTDEELDFIINYDIKYRIGIHEG